MAYIWINPVTAGMYEPDVLKHFLMEHGYTPFDTFTDWLSIVKEKYRSAIEQSEHAVIDMRCPKIKELLVESELEKEYNVTVPEIHPILIHCGQEAGERQDLKEEEKIITTPCQALADMGNSLKLPNTKFMPWNRFLQLVGEEPAGVLPQESPIPPGFFTELGVKTISITGEEEIRNYFAHYVPDEVDLVEMLYCKDGCHNGDGIIGCMSCKECSDTKNMNQDEFERKKVHRT